MVRVFRLYQAGHLPDQGGSMDQSASMMDALADMEAFEQRLTAPNADPLTVDGDIDYAEKGRIAAKSWGIDTAS